ncbi:patatin-like phospholipase family protein [Pseudoalteromonas sp. S16_S37]|uniref:patatin-like phospholipase family protein n=1 Tax=Pseudoalteromonas sp. S16_S37 TaxID=2720228 RepID=UPI00167FEF69|nr:patatin family protein [Pseudoalteromonas sp. S16_S37]MBD1584883.1 patatin family protein [Pseudoalteromonas sp. S16_S37]
MQAELSVNIQESVHVHKPEFALVAEGGGQKGIFTAGVLDAFLEENFWPFDLKVGVSAGAQNLAAYSARAKQCARIAIAQLTTDDTFFKPSKFFTDGKVIDLDWYFSQVNHSPKLRVLTDPNYLAQDSHFYVVATDAETLEARYFHTWHENMLEHLKASSAIPFLYQGGVNIAGRNYMDGGMADPIPVKWAPQQGAKQILVIRTFEQHHNGHMPILERLKPLMSRIKQSQKMLDLYHYHQARYDEALEFIKNPPKDVRIIQIAPNRPLQSMVLGSSAQMLQYDYLLGLRHGKNFLRR